MRTRTHAAAVGQAHMALKEKWTVYKCMKNVLVPGTALFMIWTADDVKLHPSTVFQGNIRIASLQGTAAGFHVFAFKENVGRKVRSQDMDKIVTVSNNIVASRQGVHQAAKALTPAKKREVIEVILPPVPDPKVRGPGNLYQHSRNRDVRWKRIIISDKEIRTGEGDESPPSFTTFLIG